MARHLRSLGIAKIVYALDSYEGFKPSELEIERRLGLASPPDDAFKSTSFDYVRAKIRKLGFEDIVIPVKGFLRRLCRTSWLARGFVLLLLIVTLERV